MGGEIGEKHSIFALLTTPKSEFTIDKMLMYSLYIYIYIYSQILLTTLIGYLALLTH